MTKTIKRSIKNNPVAIFLNENGLKAKDFVEVCAIKKTTYDVNIYHLSNLENTFYKKHAQEFFAEQIEKYIKIKISQLLAINVNEVLTNKKLLKDKKNPSSIELHKGNF